MSWSSSGSSGSIAVGSIVIDLTLEVAGHLNGDHPAAGRGLDVLVLELLLRGDHVLPASSGPAGASCSCWRLGHQAGPPGRGRRRISSASNSALRRRPARPRSAVGRGVGDRGRSELAHLLRDLQGDAREIAQRLRDDLAALAAPPCGGASCRRVKRDDERAPRRSPPASPRVRHIASTSSSARTASTTAGHSSVTRPRSSPPTGGSATGDGGAGRATGSGAGAGWGAGAGGAPRRRLRRPRRRRGGCGRRLDARQRHGPGARPRAPAPGARSARGAPGGRVDLRAGRLHSASSSCVRASAPSRTAFMAAASRSSRRTASACADAAGLLGQARVAIGRDRDLGRDRAERLDDEQLARVDLEVAHEAAHVAAGCPSRATASSADSARAAATASSAPNSEVGVGDAEHREDVVDRDRRAGVGHELLERAERVAERAGRVAGEQRDRVGPISIAPGSATRRTHGGELLDGRAREVEAVAAVDDRRQHLAGLGRREHEDRVRRRLLERLEERVPRLRREHVRLVEDVDLVRARRPARRRRDSRRSRMSSTELLDAASISMTSIDVALRSRRTTRRRRTA